MEKNIAILMADLSGYTALTEAHGAVSAADLVDKYVSIIKKCLAGDSWLHERTGDEVMVVSQSPDCLLATAIMIMKAMSNEDYFLQVHGGLHYGPVLKRNDRFFGSAINLTARIASKAVPGTFWCSEEFLQKVSDQSAPVFQPKGKHGFKNIREDKEVYELINDHESPFSIDPVCKMLLLNKDKQIKYPRSNDVFFCSNACRDIYLRESFL